MRESARLQFSHLKRLSSRDITQALIDGLEQREGGNFSSADRHFLKANLSRRCGDLGTARASFEAYLSDLNGSSAANVPRHAIAPAGLATNEGHTIAPIVVIDDFLPRDEMSQLHLHACGIEEKFRKANTSSDRPEYDPDKRQTLVTWDFGYKRDFFLRYVEANLTQLQETLGLPQFAIERIEIKMTCHVDGGFFKTHTDNHGAIGEQGRAITWLYYFGEDPPRHRGGDLFVLDSNIEERSHSPVWFTRIEPKPGRFVAFPSWFFHAVGPTVLDSDEFAAGRFAVSSHIRKPADGLEWPANG